LSEKLPLPYALSAKDLPGGRTQVLNVRRNRLIAGHPAKGDEDCGSECNSDTEHWLHLNSAMDDPNSSEDDPVADNESNIQLENTIEGTRIPEHGNVRAATNVPELIWPT
jgi:hypothetical protein